eukprot:1154782-Pelagomonas_calceolata.AAC.2
MGYDDKEKASSQSDLLMPGQGMFDAEIHPHDESFWIMVKICRMSLLFKTARLEELERLVAIISCRLPTEEGDYLVQHPTELQRQENLRLKHKSTKAYRDVTGSDVPYISAGFCSVQTIGLL